MAEEVLSITSLIQKSPLSYPRFHFRGPSRGPRAKSSTVAACSKQLSQCAPPAPMPRPSGASF
eukprot:7269819-Alexandrium_andersonii.AAC.1